jgi:type IV pilus assembly protein PilB
MLDIGVGPGERQSDVAKLVRMVLLLAVKDESDLISFEPRPGHMVMRYRCAGAWYDMVPPPSQLAPKIVGELHRVAPLPAVPQPGWAEKLRSLLRRRSPRRRRVRSSRLLVRIGSAVVDGQVNFLPTAAGERALVCLRARGRVRRAAKEALNRYLSGK